jgi:glycosyltransferase involved in cell wall biosynthesis
MLNHNVAWTGTFVRCAQFARRLVRRGYPCTIVTISPHARLHFRTATWEGVEILEAPDLLWGIGRTGWDPWDVVLRLLYLRPREFDLIHAFDSRPAVVHPALALKARRGIPLVMDWADWWGRGGTASERRNPLLRYGFIHLETFYEEHFRRRADATTVISRALGERAIALGIPPDTITRIGSGADLESFRPIARQEARRGIGFAGDGPLLGFMGNVQYDLDLVLATFARVHQVLPQCQLLLTGRRSPLVARFRADEPAGTAVHEAGLVPFDTLNLHMAACDILLLPLRDTQANRARYPQKACDYLAAGRPVLTNPTGEIGELFRAHAVGVAVAADPAAMAETICTLLADTERLTQLGTNARRVAETELSYDLLTDRLLDVYHRCAP